MLALATRLTSLPYPANVTTKVIVPEKSIPTVVFPSLERLSVSWKSLSWSTIAHIKLLLFSIAVWADAFNVIALFAPLAFQVETSLEYAVLKSTLLKSSFIRSSVIQILFQMVSSWKLHQVEGRKS